MKCAAEYLGENYDESAKYLKNAFNLKQNENNDHMQYELACNSQYRLCRHVDMRLAAW